LIQPESKKSPGDATEQRAGQGTIGGRGILHVCGNHYPIGNFPAWNLSLSIQLYQ
jgi:hypothetical protein